LSEKQFRNKVCFAAFFFSLMVVMIHSYNADMFLALPASSPGGRAVWAFEHILADVLGPMAVPGFFMISAYQFYRNCSFWDVVPKMERRIRTVLIPYLLWNFFYYAGYALAGKIPFLAGLSDKTAVEFSIPVMVEAVLHFTYNPVFWYMYQLIFLIALSPVLYPLLKNRVAGLAALLLELYCIKNLVNLPVINMDALFYYSAAAYGALHGSWLVEEGWKKERTDRKKTETERTERIRRLEPWLRLLTVAAGIGLAVYFYQGITVRHSVLETVLYRFTVPVTIWAAVSGTRLPEAGEWMKYGFFLYTIHFILARGMNKAAAMLLPHTAASALLVYLVIPAVCVITAWKLGDFLKKHTGPFWRLINGGR
jgi:hypothetical protein